MTGRGYSIFDTDQNYFDDYKNGEICRKVAHKCYLPANRLMLKLIRQFEGRFRIAAYGGTVLRSACMELNTSATNGAAGRNRSAPPEGRLK